MAVSRTIRKKTVGKNPTSVLDSDPQDAWRQRLAYFESRQQEIVCLIRSLVEVESPSHDKPAADRIGALLAEKFRALGGTPRLHRAKEYGNHLQVDFPGSKKTKPVLLLGHFDTVYPLGTLGSMPCKIADGRLYGPGVFDMKSGIALMLHAIEELQIRHGELPRPVTIFLVSDEEVGSHSSRAITESLARKSAAVFVLEPAAGLRGAVKTARQGAAIGKLNDLQNGISVNPGVIRGGTRSNVIAAEASAVIDVRIKKAKQAAELDRKLRSLKPFDRHCKLEITGGVNRLPMERTAGVAALYRQARQLAQQIDWNLEEAAVGGGSDGNFTAGIGIPTLDGMGGVGDGAHAVHEYIEISELPRRALLLAGMIENS